MAIDAWPGALPQKPLIDFTSSIVNGLLDEQEAINPLRNRTNPEYEAAFAFNISSSQIATIKTFYNTTLKEGKYFSAPWLTDAGFENCYARFRIPPKISCIGRLRFKLEILLEIIRQPVYEE